MSNDAPGHPPLRPRAAAALQRLKSCQRPAEALEAVGEIVSQLIGCEEFVVLARDSSGTGFAHAASLGLPEARVHALMSAPDLLGQVAREGGVYIAGRTRGVSSSAQEAELSACIPLSSGGQVGGVLALFRLLPQKRGFDEEDFEILELLATHGGVALPAVGKVALPAGVPPPSVASAASDVRGVFLHPGEIFVSRNPSEVTTILGSCVAVCLWDPHLHIGGLNHFLLPSAPGASGAAGRFGDTAIPALVSELERLGSQRQHLRAKVFGGAAVGGIAPGGKAGLGQRNAELARQLLGELGISLVAEDLGGTTGRKLRFRTDDGSALVKKLGGG
ncbi:GAF domain-containing protein [Hyalangium rubrum]|uniref:Probable chemoreceptor glutamine deamidase CheD n=1 Tax=Hyalangium rubrum TaxID=3103134 RepID=A0ABU5H602_9BACT|nr:GAF domain-containing protein [Hyalangium sp. s54d21]MDY7228299.1 GAF domain-containing protein [Hyalangium sp. s54d21]